MKVPDLNVEKNDLFVVSYGEYDETYVYGPFQALEKIASQTLVKEFAQWISEGDNLERSLDQKITPLHSGLPGGEQAEGHAFIIWLALTKRAVLLDCHWMGFRAGKHRDGRSFMMVGNSLLSSPQEDYPSP